jgi:hypothetical protein
LTSILAKREEEIGKLRDENQRLKEKNLFLQDGSNLFSIIFIKSLRVVPDLFKTTTAYKIPFIMILIVHSQDCPRSFPSWQNLTNLNKPRKDGKMRKFRMHW